jgi:acyl-CoA reductase-like NAD-dependent aldehyde dehydrogenase
VNIDEAQVRAIVAQVVNSIGTPAQTSAAPDAGGNGVNPAPITYGNGVFRTISDCTQATKAAQQAWIVMPLEKRKAVVEAVRRVGIENAEMFARETVAETGMGRVADKIEKHRGVCQLTPGFEDIESKAWSGDDGLTIEEMAPYGVVGAVTPSTHPVPTMLNNTISNLTAGNGVVFNGHPGAKKVFAHGIQVVNQYIVAAGGPENLVTTTPEPTLDSAAELFGHPDIRMLLVTGGSGVVNAAMKSGKKVVAAGPGNPPVVVDETADLERAARGIIAGAAFDCNVLCIAEKEIFAVDTIADELKRRMIANGAYELTTQQIEQLAEFVFSGDAGCAHPVLNREAVGRDAEALANQIGITVPPTTRLLIGETSKSHAFVQAEQMTSFVPFVRCTDVNQAIDQAIESEHGFRHTVIMHSTDLNNLDRMARLCDATIFVKNGASGAGVGSGGEGTLSYSIAGPTGEGITTARTFTRRRRCALVDYFRIV